MKRIILILSIFVLDYVGIYANYVTIDDINWSYVILSDGTVEIRAENVEHSAISSSTEGEITVPKYIDGKLVTSIGRNAFSGCSKLTKVNLPNDIKSINGSAFRFCSGLSSITFPPNLSSLGERAFEGCSGITEIIIPESLTSIPNYAFADCNHVSSITIPSGATVIGDYAFFNIDSVESVEIPSSIISIGEAAFNNMDKLSKVIIPENVISIGRNAFANCATLSEISIPNSVSSIGTWAFAYLPSLKKIVSYIQEPFAIDSRVFLLESLGAPQQPIQHYTSATLYVPKNTKNKYQGTAGWSLISNIVELTVSSIPSDVNGDGIVNAADIVELVNYIIESADKYGDANYDVNADGAVNAADIVSIVNAIMSQRSQTQ